MSSTAGPLSSTYLMASSASSRNVILAGALIDDCFSLVTLMNLQGLLFADVVYVFRLPFFFTCTDFLFIKLISSSSSCARFSIESFVPFLPLPMLKESCDSLELRATETLVSFLPTPLPPI